MKLTHMLATAGLVVASLGVSATADARQYRGDRYDQRDRHDDRGYRDGRHDHGRFERGHDRCRIEYRHHRQVRVCR